MSTKAVIVGGGIAGILAARVLADHFDEVTILERDTIPADPKMRVGVPQAHHTHVFLNAGVRAIEKYVPGLQQDLAAAGAVPINYGPDIKFLSAFGWTVRPQVEFHGHQCSRPLLEHVVRKRVMTNAKIHTIEKQHVSGIEFDRGAARGVRVGDKVHEGDLVIDASGKLSVFPKWLKEGGFEPPPETVVDGHLGYSSRVLERKDDGRDWKAMYLQVVPWGDKRGATLFPVEGNRWYLSLVGAGGEYPPVEEAGFMEFAKSLRVPDLYNYIKDLKPLSIIHGSRSTMNRFRHIQRLKRWPERFIVFGDAALHANPFYGQGMTLSTLQAVALDKCLTEKVQPLPQTFHKMQAKVVAGAWMLATSYDYRVPGCDGGPAPFYQRMMHKHLERVLKLVTKDVYAASTMASVLHLVKPPTALIAPKMLLKTFTA